ncbi:MAG: PSD1 and planctomycete cytochrome C domain-containing protein [Armatimonadota bacterium]
MQKTYPLIVTILPALLLTAAAAARQGASARVDVAGFEKKIRPVLIRECIPCHGASQQKGGLRLDTEPQTSDIKRIKAVLTPGNAIQMPPSGALSTNVRAEFMGWLDSGASWPKAAPTTSGTSDPKKHWAFLPPKRPSIPNIDKSPTVNPIDVFVNKRLAADKLVASAKADRRTLIRRATYDLTGLPPTPQEVVAFLADKRPGAWERVIDRLLASPHYGEKWGRLWLDIVHYADTAGENSDHPLPHMWKYRNWVINAFNTNLPYNTFLEHQLAGDLLAETLSGDKARNARIATGFLAGTRRFGHDIDADMHLTYEDVIDTTSKATLGLSLACARCHDHKFDPIPQRDYYALYGIFQSTRFSYPGCEPFQQPKFLVPLTSTAEQTARESELQQLEHQVNNQPIHTLPKETTLVGSGRVPDAGAVEMKAPNGGELQVDLAAGDVLLFEVDPNGSHGADTTRLEMTIRGTDSRNAVVRNATELLDVLPGDMPWTADWMFVDLTGGVRALSERLTSISSKAALRGWRSGETPSVFGNVSQNPVDVWTTLPGRSLYVHPGPRGSVGLAWTSPTSGRYSVSGRVSDAHPGGDGVTWKLHKIPGGKQLIAAVMASSSKARNLETQIAALRLQRTIDVAFACTEGNGADARVQLKGDPAVPGALVARGAPSFLGLPGGKVTTGSGRLELAKWITRRQNPLTARVWVNRLWQGHFGNGIVATPNDFGLRGAPPTNQPLLDWLATTFMDGGWDTKRLHKLMMTSETYQRQSGDGHRASALASFPRRRLTAEELRDTYLYVSGQLDVSPGGAHPFPPEAGWSFTQHTPFADEYDSNKRSVYVMQKRNRRTPFFALFDGPDPNTSTAVRDNTTVPTQALWLMNSSFVQSSGAALAQRTSSATGDPDKWITALYRMLLGRYPSPMEKADFYAIEYLLYDGQAGTTPRAWNVYVKAMLVSNEVLYVD